MSSFHPRSFPKGGASIASIICPSFEHPGEVYDFPHEKARSRRRRPGAARPGEDREMARPHLRPHPALRSRALDISMRGPRRASHVVDVGGVPAVAARDGTLRHPLRHPLVEARTRSGGRLGPLHRRARATAAGGGVRAAARGPRLHDQHRARRPARRRRGARAEAQRQGSGAGPRRADAPRAASALFLEIVQVAARLRVPGRESAGLLGAERLPHARRPVDRRALLRPGDTRDAADARRGRAHAAGEVVVRAGGRRGAAVRAAADRPGAVRTVRVERAGPVTTVVLDRPEFRNAVDRETAAALADAFRAVDAREAERIGLANRVVAKGHARASAEALAAEIAAFPPRCVLSDRRSAYESAGGPLEVALRREFELGRATIDAGESRDGAARFAAGAGRHGTWEPRHGPQAPSRLIAGSPRPSTGLPLRPS